MASILVKPPFTTYVDTKGEPLEAGYIYIGTSGLEPSSSPINVYWDVAQIYPAAQPIRTIAGAPSRDGSAAVIYIESSAYSIKVEDKNNVLVYSANVPVETISPDNIDSTAAFVLPTMLSLQKGTDIPSAATITVPIDGNYFDVTGTTNISAINTIGASNTIFWLRFTASLTVVHSASLDLPGAANITVGAGDHMALIEYTTGSFKVMVYQLYSSLLMTLDTVQTVTGDKTFSGVTTHSGTVKFNKGATVPSEAALFTTSGFPMDGNYTDVSGVAGITSIITSGEVGTVFKLHFEDILILTHDATGLSLPGGNNITTKAGDEAEFIEYAGGDWRCTNYLGNISSFSVDRNSVNQSMAAASDTKVLWTTKNFDENSDFDVVTNHRHTPTIAGKYMYGTGIWMLAISTGDAAQIKIKKNGATVATRVKYNNSAGDQDMAVGTSKLIEMNGTTDYVEVFVLHGSGTKNLDGSTAASFFYGFLK